MSKERNSICLRITPKEYSSKLWMRNKGRLRTLQYSFVPETRDRGDIRGLVWLVATADVLSES